MSRKKLIRLTVVTLCLILSMAITWPDLAAAGKVTWKMATKMPPESPEGKVFQKLADLVKEKSNDMMVIDVFPAEQLGKTEAAIEQLQAGLIQIYPEGETYLQKYEPGMKNTSLPFLFQNREHWARFMASSRVQGWLDAVAKNHNIMVLGKTSDFLRGPYRVMVSKKPIAGLSDINGIKLRLHPDDVAIAAWKHLGASTIVLPWTEIYESLGRGIIEACNSPMALVESMKFYEQAKNIVRHDEYPQGIAFMTNYEAFQALSPELKKIVLDSHKEACAYSVEIMSKIADESIARMEAKGAKYSTIDTKPFVARMNELYRQWEKEGKLPKGFLEDVTALAQ